MRWSKARPWYIKTSLEPAPKSSSCCHYILVCGGINENHRSSWIHHAQVEHSRVSPEAAVTIQIKGTVEWTSLSIRQLTKLLSTADFGSIRTSSRSFSKSFDFHHTATKESYLFRPLKLCREPKNASFRWSKQKISTVTEETQAD